METPYANLPTHLKSKILARSRVARVVGDDMLDRFLIKECYEIPPDLLFQSLVKKRRRQSLSHFFRVFHEQQLSFKSVKTVVQDLLKRKAFEFAISICTWCPSHASLMRSHMFQFCILKMTMSKSIEVLRLWFEFMKDYHSIVDVVEIEPALYIMTSKNLKGLVEASFADDIFQFLHNNGYIHDTLQDVVSHQGDLEVKDVMRSIIEMNRVSLMMTLMKTGYKVTIANIIQCIVVSNIDMNRLLLTCFRPRFYSAKFADYLTDICNMRGNDELCTLLKSIL